MATLELKNIHKSYGKVDVIHGIDLSIDSGDFCVFVGPSGCGKSTLLRMIAGLESITAGEVMIDSEVVNSITAANRGLAMVFQSYALYPHMSVRSNLSFGLENLNMPKAEIANRVDEAARMLQIEDLLKRRPGQLSGGQRQRVAIGRAVVREPKIFLFDEPLSNLDAELRVAMRGEISDLHQRLGNTMVYVTHDQVEAMTMADKIAVLRAGKVEQYGKPLDIYNHPVNRFVAGFIGSPRMNFIEATVSDTNAENITMSTPSGSAIQLDAITFNAGHNQQVSIGVRANHLELVDPDKGEFVMEVSSTEQLGGETYLYGSVGQGSDFTVHLPGQVMIERGERIGVILSKTETQLFDGDSGVSLRV